MPALGKSGTSRISFFSSSISTSYQKRCVCLGYGNFFFDNLGHTGRPRTALKFLPKTRKQRFLGFTVDFDVARSQVADIASDVPPAGGFLRKITISDALDVASNEIVSGCNQA